MKEKYKHYKINESYRKFMPNNCPVIEETADGICVGTCSFYLKDGVCPRHGKIEEYEDKSKENKNGH